MAKKQGSIIGLDMGRSSLKLVEFLPQRREIVSVAFKPIDATRIDDEAYMSSKIKECISQTMKASPSEIVACVPGEYTTVHSVQVPNDEDNAQDFIYWELEQYLGNALDEYFVDYVGMGSNSKETSRFFQAVAFRKSEVEKLQRIIGGAGYALSVLDVDVFASQNIFEVNYPDQISSSTLIIKADLHGAKLVWTQRGEFLGFKHFAPSTPFSSEGPNRAKQIAEITEQLKAELANKKNPTFCREAVTNMLVCGDLARDEDFVAALESDTNSVLSRLNPFKELNYQPPKDEEAVAMQIAPQFATATGLALRRGGDC